MNAILQALFALVPFSTDLLNVTDTLDADSSSSSANNQRSVVLMLDDDNDDDDDDDEKPTGFLQCFDTVGLVI